MQSRASSPSPMSSRITILLFLYGIPLSTAAGKKEILISECSCSMYQCKACHRADSSSIFRVLWIKEKGKPECWWQHTVGGHLSKHIGNGGCEFEWNIHKLLSPQQIISMNNIKLYPWVLFCEATVSRPYLHASVNTSCIKMDWCISPSLLLGPCLHLQNSSYVLSQHIM